MEAATFDTVFGGMTERNEEGVIVVGHGHQGLPFTEENVLGYARHPRTHSAGGPACTWRGAGGPHSASRDVYGQAGRSQTVASGGRVSCTLSRRPFQATGSDFSGSGLVTSLPPYAAASVLSTSRSASTPSGTPIR